MYLTMKAEKWKEFGQFYPELSNTTERAEQSLQKHDKIKCVILISVNPSCAVMESERADLVDQ